MRAYKKPAQIPWSPVQDELLGGGTLRLDHAAGEAKLIPASGRARPLDYGAAMNLVSEHGHEMEKSKSAGTQDYWIEPDPARLRSLHHAYLRHLVVCARAGVITDLAVLTAEVLRELGRADRLTRPHRRAPSRPPVPAA